MKRMMLAGMILVSASVGAQQDVQVLDDRWYAGVSGGVARLGSDRLTDSTAPYFGAYFGRFLSPNFSLDIQIDSYSTDFERDEFGIIAIDPPPNFDRDFDIYGYGLTGRYHFGEAGNQHRPYGLVGLGIQEHDNFLDDGRDFYLSWGIGVESKLGDNFRWRTQVEGRYDNERETFGGINRSDGFIDFIASVGLSYSFGEPPRPPRPVSTPPEPVRPAPPAPAPEPAPAPAPEPEPEPEVLFEFDSAVLFAFDSADLRAEARTELDRAADILAPRDAIILIEVAGHTDSVGPEDYNQGLSERRAQSVADYLAGKGIERERMRVVGYGESRPRVPNDSPENRQKNRRVVLSILERRD